MIAILDFGSQYSKLIARKIRENNVYCEVLPHTIKVPEIKRKNVLGIILSGGPSSVFEKDAPQCTTEIYNLNIPILGICYGMQLMAHHLGGEIIRGEKHEYGPANLYIDNNFGLFNGLWLEMSIWMSHGDQVIRMPKNFKRLAHTENCQIASFAYPEKNFYGVQFHPEVTHTKRGTEILQNFIFNICKCTKNWTATSFLESSIKNIQDTVKNDHVLCALSGGVDSTTVAALLKKAIGDQVTCMFIDHGLMRKNEGERIKDLFTNQFKINLIYINAKKRFFDKIKGISDPEEKRKKIGEEFIRTFEEESEKLSKKFKFLAQGTLYPDVIESAVGEISKTAQTIKSHHNVGGLPKDIKFKIIEPLRLLFKDEVRKLGSKLQIPFELINRQPFPGPGLAIRIIEEITEENVSILQNADYIVIDEIKKANLYHDLWQAFAILLPLKTVGVQGDKRSYSRIICLRAVKSTDAMTANWAHLPYALLDKISNRIINEIPDIGRVVYDISSKPPATIEWE